MNIAKTTTRASSRRCPWIMRSINTGVILKIMNIAKTTTRASSRRVARARLLGRLNGGSPLNLLCFFSGCLQKIRSVRMLDTFACSGRCFGSSPSVELATKVGSICPFVVIDSADLGATIVVANALCSTIFNPSRVVSPTQRTCLVPDAIKLESVRASDEGRPARAARDVTDWQTDYHTSTDSTIITKTPKIRLLHTHR